MYHDGQLLFFFFLFCSFRKKHGISKLDVLDCERKCLGLKRRNIKRRVSAVILSIKACLTGWVMSGNHLSERDRLTQALSDLAVWTTQTKSRKLSSLSGISLATESHANDIPLRLFQLLCLSF